MAKRDPPIPIVPPGVETRVGLYFWPTIPLIGSKGKRIGVPTKKPTATMRYGDLSRVWKTSWRAEYPLFVRRYSTLSGRYAAVGLFVSMYLCSLARISGWSKTTGRYISRQGIFMSVEYSIEASRSMTVLRSLF
jgi:hypothetical protein